MPELPHLVGVAAPFREAPGGRVIGKTRCDARLYVYERSATATFVAAYEHSPPYDLDAKVVQGDAGWIDDADLAASAQNPDCSGPMYMYDARVGVRRAARLMPPMLVEADHARASSDSPPSFWRVRYDDEGRRACVEARIANDRLVEGPDGTGTRQRVTWGFSLAEDGSHLLLTGPTIEALDDPSQSLSYSCAHPMAVVTRSKEAWILVPRTGSGGTEFAYAPELATRWYTSRDACERTLGSGPRATVIARHGCG